MDLYWRQRTEWSRKSFPGHRLSFGNRLAREQLSGHTGHSDSRLASERLETRPIDHFSSVFLLEFQPHSEHVAAIRTADCSYRIGVFHLAEVARIFGRLLDLGL